MPEKFELLPFLTREMLAFGKSSSFQIIVSMVSHDGWLFRLRGMTRSGTFTNEIITAGTGAIETFTFNMTDIPISISMTADESGNPEAVAYATVHLAINGNRILMLTQGIVNGLIALAWPYQSPATDPQTQGGFHLPTLTDPAAGANIAHTVPANQIWEIISLNIELACSGTVADRTMIVQFLYPSDALTQRTASATQQASETQNYYIIPGGTTQVITANSDQEIAIPTRVILPPGSQIRTLVTNLQAGDQLDFIAADVRITYLAS